jgi:hypothetical protein
VGTTLERAEESAGDETGETGETLTVGKTDDKVITDVGRDTGGALLEGTIEDNLIGE